MDQVTLLKEYVQFFWKFEQHPLVSKVVKRNVIDSTCETLPFNATIRILQGCDFLSDDMKAVKCDLKKPYETDENGYGVTYETHITILNGDSEAILKKAGLIEDLTAEQLKAWYAEVKRHEEAEANAGW